MRRVVCAALICVLASALIAFIGGSLSAHPDGQFEEPCDFLTGGGFVLRAGSKANFGIGGGCKDGAPTWGHLEYNDHGTGLSVHWTSITAYFPEGTAGTDPKTGQPTGTRWICGTARTNQYGDVGFAVRAADIGEPGASDEFDLWLTQSGAPVYSTTDDGIFPHDLGGAGKGGGNIQLHKPNPSTTGEFGGACPAYPFDAPEPEPEPTVTRFEESAATYAGDWHSFGDAHTGVASSDGTVTAAFSALNTATFSFTGSGVSWIGFPCESCGIANVYVDGALMGTVDTFAPSRPSGTTVMFTASGLGPGAHTLTIETTASRNPLSQNSWVAIDAYDVTP